ncbi:hypothetical protein SRHO_G00306960 [Serrasalmus rhombeus]
MQRSEEGIRTGSCVGMRQGPDDTCSVGVMFSVTYQPVEQRSGYKGFRHFIAGFGYPTSLSAAAQGSWFGAGTTVVFFIKVKSASAPMPVVTLHKAGSRRLGLRDLLR